MPLRKGLTESPSDDQAPRSGPPPPARPRARPAFLPRGAGFFVRPIPSRSRPDGAARASRAACRPGSAKRTSEAGTGARPTQHPARSSMPSIPVRRSGYAGPRLRPRCAP